MINLRKYTYMYDVVCRASDFVDHPYSFWYRLFPEDPHFPSLPKVNNEFLGQWDTMKRFVEQAIESCWQESCRNGDWQKNTYVKKILASAGF